MKAAANKCHWKEFDNQKSRPLKSKIGDQVYAVKELREGKFGSGREEPFTIVGFTENENVILEHEFGERCMKYADKLLVFHGWSIRSLLAPVTDKRWGLGHATRGNYIILCITKCMHVPKSEKVLNQWKGPSF